MGKDTFSAQKYAFRSKYAVLYSKTCVKRLLSKNPKLVRLMQVKSIAEEEHSAILSIFIKLKFVIKVFVLSIFEWPFNTGFTSPESVNFFGGTFHVKIRCVLLGSRPKTESIYTA